MKKSDETRREAVQALLGLGLTRERAEFRVPSDEELAQLLEPQASEPLDATRKAQIMDAIANDPETFRRWAAFVETAEIADIGHFAPGTEPEQAVEPPARASMLSRFREFISDHMRGLMATGGTAGIAMALVLSMPGGMDSKVSGLYDDYGSHWDSLPETVELVRGADDTESPPLSPADQRLKDGLEAGLAALGSHFSLRQLNPSNTDTSSLSEPLSESLLTLGEVAAITYFKCYLGAEPGFFDDSLKLMEELAPALRVANNETADSLMHQLDRPGKAETKVCRLSKAAVERVSG
ncbi:hypothetical protein [Allohahella marinimesophila]|uniref:Uncharacterized protein n=1 Tax=Allohahella marinimesophila TaxID=1054972 RepID=A0ABP7PHE1_9GAMM